MIEQDEDENEPLDKLNMNFMKDVANEIHQCIQVTKDYPSKNPTGKMPNAVCLIRKPREQGYSTGRMSW